MYKLKDDSSTPNIWAFNTRDLMRASTCDHCIKLAIAKELDMPGVRALVAPYALEGKTLAMAYGDKFESEIEEELRASLGEGDFKRPEGKDAFAETVALMHARVPVIYQGALRHRSGLAEFTGRPDFLVRGDYDLEFLKGKLVAKPSKERAGAAGYIAWDAKLASSAKPHYLLQVALYVEALDALGLKANALHGLILGSRTLELFEEGEIVPAMRQARSYLEAAFQKVADGELSDFELKHLSLHCEVQSTCTICEYPDLCQHNRKEIDHLVQIAGINKSQIEKLKKAGITTMAALAGATDDQRPSDFVPGSFDKLRKQAKLQTSFRETGQHSYVVVDDPEIGVLPPASPNDIFFDMEGFPYFEEKGGLEYLFGAITRDANSKEKLFHEFWAHDREQEAVAFADFVKFAYDKLQADPTAHVYHYAPYEVTALNKLASRHGVMEAEVDWLIGQGKMIDLYKVVKGSIMVSQPSYSIKKLEAFYHFGRKSTVVDAGSSIEEYDYYRQLTEQDPAEAKRVLQTIADYNEDDCVSTLALYEWLSSMPGAHAKYSEFRQAVDRKKAEWAADPEDQDSATNKAERELAELQRATDHMAKAIADWHWGENTHADYHAKIWQALMHSVLYYKREEVITFRERYLRREAVDETLHADRKALVVSGCVREASGFDGMHLNPSVKITLDYTYELDPGQTLMLKAGTSIYVRFSYGANQNELDKGTLVWIDGNRIGFSRTTTIANANFEPNAIFEDLFIRAGGKQDAVRDNALGLANEWVSPMFEAPTGNATLDLLMRRAPSLIDDGELMPVQSDDYLPSVINAVERMHRTVLAIQGPPGSGKTYLGSRTIAHLVEQGKKIAVVANSHSAVENLLAGCVDAGVSGAVIAKQPKKEDRTPREWTTPSGYSVMKNWRAKQAGGYVIGGTAWTFCSSYILLEEFDYIFIDEAAQFSLVDAIAVGGGSTNMVLLGDPMQLTQVVQAVHPGGVDNSALGHFMGDQQILDAQHGYFVEVTRRMHPSVNAPVSWLSYQNRLHSHTSAAEQSVTGLTPGFELHPIQHIGNSSHSPEEVDAVLALTQKHLELVGQDEVLIVAPYNAQVDAIRDSLDAAGLTEVQVGTVDKFQGREAHIVIVSLAASTAEDAPRGLEFLLDRNRLNVALSRAKTNSYLVYSPELIRTRFNNVEDVKAISRLAGLLAFAK
jgi:predicted RecB family nuclease